MTLAQEAIEAAINMQIVCRFAYPNSDGRLLLRTFSPFEVRGESCVGWDHGRDEVRRYRFDKMGGTFTPLPDEEYVQPQS